MNNHASRARIVNLGLALAALGGALGCGATPDVEITIESRNDATKAYPPPKNGRVLPNLGQLTGLSLSPKVLVPAFSPDVHDYVVRCGEGANPVTLSASSSGGRVYLVTPAAAAPLDGYVAESLFPNGAVMVQAAGGEYWVRCLPPDFPDLVATVGPGVRTPGFYVAASDAAGDRAPYVMVLDEQGTPVYYQRGSGAGFRRVEAFSAGTLTFSASQSPVDKESKGFVTITLEPYSESWINAAEPEHDHYADPVGFVRTPSHQTWLVTHERIGPPASDPSARPVLDCVVQHLDAMNQLVDRWSASAHVDASEVLHPEVVAVGGELYDDPYGCSGLDATPAGDVLLTAKGLGAVLLIQPDGTVRWKLGGTVPVAPETATLAMAAGEELAAPEDARFVQGNWISVYDGGGDVARAVEYLVDPDAKLASTVHTVVGSEKGPGGGYRAYADGSRVVTWGKSGRSQEVDADGKPAITLQLGGGSPAAVGKVPLWYFDRSVLRRGIVLN